MPYLTINEMGRMELDDSSEMGKFKIGKIFKPLKKVIGTILKVTPIGIVATLAKKQMVDNPRKKQKKKAGQAEAAANADAQAQADALNAQAAAVNASMAPQSSGDGSYPPSSEPMFQDQQMMTEAPQGQSMDQQMMTPEQAQEIAMQQSVAQAQATAPEPIQYEMPAPVITEGPRGGGHMTEQDWGYTPQEAPVFEDGAGRRRSREIQDPFAAYQAGQMEGFLTDSEKTDNLTVGHRGRIIKKPSRPDMVSTFNGRKNWMKTLRNPQGNKDEWISPAFQNFWGDKRTMTLNPRPYLAKRDKTQLPGSLSGPHGHHGGHHGGGGYMFPSYPLYPYPLYDYPYPPASLDYKPTDDVNYDSLTEEERKKKGLSGLGRGFFKKKKKKGPAPVEPAVVVVPPPFMFPMGPPPPMPKGYDPQADDEVPPLDLMTQQEFVRSVKSGSERSDRTSLGGWFRKKKKRSGYTPAPAAPPPAATMFSNKKWGFGFGGLSGLGATMERADSRNTDTGPLLVRMNTLAKQIAANMAAINAVSDADYSRIASEKGLPSSESVLSDMSVATQELVKLNIQEPEPYSTFATSAFTLPSAGTLSSIEQQQAGWAAIISTLQQNVAPSVAAQMSASSTVATNRTPSITDPNAGWLKNVWNHMEASVGKIGAGALAVGGGYLILTSVLPAVFGYLGARAGGDRK